MKLIRMSLWTYHHKHHDEEDDEEVDDQGVHYAVHLRSSSGDHGTPWVG